MPGLRENYVYLQYLLNAPPVHLFDLHPGCPIHFHPAGVGLPASTTSYRPPARDISSGRLTIICQHVTFHLTAVSARYIYRAPDAGNSFTIPPTPSCAYSRLFIYRSPIKIDSYIFIYRSLIKINSRIFSSFIGKGMEPVCSRCPSAGR